MKKETKEKIKERILPKKIKWRNVIVVFAAIVGILLFAQIVFGAGVIEERGPNTQHFLRIYDMEGRYLDPSNPAVAHWLMVKIYNSDFSKLIKKAEGENNISFYSSEGYAGIKIYWHDWSDDDPAWVSTVPLYQTYVNITLNFNPAKPILNWQAESLSVSANGKSISSPFYGVTLGVGDNKNVIQLTIGSKTWNMPVTFDTSTSNSTSNNIPFKFLADQPGKKHIVEGQYNTGWFWLTTVRYASGYNATMINGNTLIQVWTYVYLENYDKQDFVKDVLAGTFAGAIVGSFAPGVGTAAGALTGAIAGATAWAIKKYLLGQQDVLAYVGVVAAIFTPRFFEIQTVTDKCNLEGATTNINNLPPNGRHAENTISYEILSASGQLQVGFTRNWGTVHTYYYDFEDATMEGWTANGTSISTDKAHSGQYSVYGNGGSTYMYKTFTDLKNGMGYIIDVGLWGYNFNGAGLSITISDTKGHTYTTDNLDFTQDAWSYNDQAYQITAIENSTLNITLTIVGGTSTGLYLDDIGISTSNCGKYRYVFTSSAPNPVVGYFPPGSGEIPVIIPASNGFSQAINERYTLIAIKKSNDTDGVLALDWQSREPMMSPARVSLGGGGLNTKADSGWSVSVWLIGTDDKDGFKDVNFTYVTSRYVWTPDFGFNPMWSNNWTIVKDFSSLIVNGTTVVIPHWIESFLNGGAGWGNNIDWGNIAMWIGIGLLILLIVAIVSKAYFNRAEKHPLIWRKKRGR